MILTGTEITRQREAGRVVIEPFDARQVNPNSYNYRLGTRLLQVDSPCLDPTSGTATTPIDIPDEGFVLQPGQLYLGTTLEEIGSEHYVVSLIGRSSLGRLGLFLQVSADLSQLGACHRWTLELVAVQQLRVYPEMVVGQISFWQPHGRKLPYRGYYGRRSAPTTSLPGHTVPRRADAGTRIHLDPSEAP